MIRARPDSDNDAHGTGDGGSGYVLRRVPKDRQPVLDRLAGASRRFQVHTLIELDVTVPKAQLSDVEPHVSWTGFVVATLARAVALHPEVNARKAGNRILYFDRVDVGATVERQWEGRTTLDIVGIRDADRASCAEISRILHEAKYGPGQSHRQSALTAQLGPTRTNKKTNFFNKTDQEGCDWAFLSSMITLTQYAQRVGGNAERGTVGQGGKAGR